MKSTTPVNPRLVVGVSVPQLEKARKLASEKGYKNEHHWAGAILRKILTVK